MKFIDHPSFAAKAGVYANISVDCDKIVASWRHSVFSFEWLNPDGTIRAMNTLPAGEAEKRRAIELQLENNPEFTKPILGISMEEHIEFGQGKALFLTLAAHGIKTIPVHIPTGNIEEFKRFLAPANPDT